MPASRTSSAATTKRRRRWPRRSASGRRHGLLNIAGGCCGTTPEHIAAIAAAVAGLPPRPLVKPPSVTRLAGLEPVVIPPPGNTFVNVGERTNVTGSRKFARLVAEGREDEAVDYRARAGRQRRPADRREHGRGDARRGRGDDSFPAPHRRRARHRDGPGHGRQLEMVGARGRPAAAPGQGRRQLDLAQGGRG